MQQTLEQLLAVGFVPTPARIHGSVIQLSQFENVTYKTLSDFLRAFLRHGVAVDTGTFNAVLEANSADIEDALELLASMKVLDGSVVSLRIVLLS